MCVAMTGRQRALLQHGLCLWLARALAHVLCDAIRGAVRRRHADGARDADGVENALCEPSCDADVGQRSCGSSEGAADSGAALGVPSTGEKGACAPRDVSDVDLDMAK